MLNSQLLTHTYTRIQRLALSQRNIEPADEQLTSPAARASSCSLEVGWLAALCEHLSSLVSCRFLCRLDVFNSLSLKANGDDCVFRIKISLHNGRVSNIAL